MAAELLLAACFVVFWAGAAMLLSCLPWFQRQRSLTERLLPYVPTSERHWTDDVENWLNAAPDIDHH